MLIVPQESNQNNEDSFEAFLNHCIVTAQGMANEAGEPRELWIEEPTPGFKAVVWIVPENRHPGHPKAEYLETFTPEGS